MEANTIDPDLTAPSLIWVYIVCNIGYQSTSAEEQADDYCFEWQIRVNSLPVITLANSLDPDHARQNVRPDLDPNCLTL